MLPRLLLSLLFSAAVLPLSVPALAETPVLSLIEQAQQCDGGAGCPYFNDVYQGDSAFRRAFDVAIKQAGLKRQYWVRKGVTTPLKPVEIEGKPRLLSSVCEPHNCGHHYSVLYDPVSHSMAGVYVGPDGKGGARTVYFGDPSIAEAAVLKQN
ncbi:Ivy family c-type lysozyme inhibitor [Janthinobacterium sp.]|uniref:Ivy family c-type lysozyme inhibitor n=1 Tax=Janthinobacterium sp. TaxID=1871054 RepID=UPI00262BFDB3|nr:Ivy family c-type lysozyme inhibitor [Janthinobacterium sp.]